MEHRSYWLELLSPAEFRPRPLALAVAAMRLRGAGATRAAALWREVGRGFWTERDDWPPARWRRHLDGAGVWFAAGALGSEDLGCFELVRTGDEVKLEGFGLLPAWRGRGLGAGWLTIATRQAFALGARRIWLRTATDDHPHALPNYLARGYRVYREKPPADPLRR